jgi:hypothetical protein
MGFNVDGVKPFLKKAQLELLESDCNNELRFIKSFKSKNALELWTFIQLVPFKDSKETRNLLAWGTL